MGASMGGMSGSQLGLGLLKGGLTGLSQGLNNYSNPQRPPQFDFSKLQQGFQSYRKPLGQGVTPNAAQPIDPNNPYNGFYG